MLEYDEGELKRNENLHQSFWNFIVFDDCNFDKFRTIFLSASPSCTTNHPLRLLLLISLCVCCRFHEKKSYPSVCFLIFRAGAIRQSSSRVLTISPIHVLYLFSYVCLFSYFGLWQIFCSSSYWSEVSFTYHTFSSSCIQHSVFLFIFFLFFLDMLIVEFFYVVNL